MTSKKGPATPKVVISGIKFKAFIFVLIPLMFVLCITAGSFFVFYSITQSQIYELKQEIAELKATVKYRSLVVTDIESDSSISGNQDLKGINPTDRNGSDPLDPGPPFQPLDGNTDEGE